MLVQCLECCLQGLVGAVVDGIECLVAEDVARNQRLEVAQDEVSRLVDSVA